VAAEAGGCNRRFSFECFFLGVNGNEPLFPSVGDDDGDDDNGGEGGGDEDDDDDAIGGSGGAGADDDRAHHPDFEEKDACDDAIACLICLGTNFLIDAEPLHFTIAGLVAQTVLFVETMS
jgi:hypothetical protein